MKYPLIILFVFFIHLSYAQSVGIGTATPDPSAILDLTSTNKGLLVPRLTTSQRDAIINPVPGLKIFNIDDFCEDTFDGLRWMKNCAQIVVSDSIRPGDHWKQLDPIPNGVLRYGMFSFSFGNKIITGLGFNNYPTDIWEYDVIKNIWTQKNNFPSTGRHATFSCVINNRGYLFGGSNLSIGEVWEYNPDTDIWTQKANFPGGQRTYLAGFAVGAKAYMGTGDGVDYNNDFWEYTPMTDTWVLKAPVPGPIRNYASSFSIGNKGYLGIGRGPTASNYISDLYEYSPSNNTWTNKQPFAGGGGGTLTNFVINDTAYVGLGVINGDILPVMYKFNPNASGNQWSAINDFPGVARAAPFCTVINNKAYLGCGTLDNSDEVNDLWVYNPYPDTLHNYKQQVPEDVNNVIYHDWSTENDTKLFATSTKYKVGIGTKAPKVKLHLEGNNDAGLGDNSGLLLVGEVDGQNIVVDNNEIMARDNGVASQLIIQNSGGNTSVGGNIRVDGKLGIDTDAAVQLHITNGGDAGYNTTTTGFLQMGATNSTNIIMDNNEIMARDNGQTSDLILQNDGGSTYLGGDLEVDGVIKGAVKVEQNIINVTTTGTTQTFSVGNKSFIRAICVSGNCIGCSGSNNCPTLILTNGESDGHMLVLRGVDIGFGLYMPGNLAATTNYRLTANFQLANNNFITLMWLSDESEWREISRAVY